MNGELVILLLAFLGVFVFVLWCFQRDTTVSSRGVPWWLASLLPLGEVFAADFGRWCEEFFPTISSTINRRCREAGLEWHAAHLYGLSMTAGLATLALTSAIAAIIGIPWHLSVVLIVLLTAASSAVPWFYLRRRAEERMGDIGRILPFAIDLICSAMSAGLDFISAVRYYTTLGYTDPLSREFSVLIRDVELGSSRSDALRAMALRVGSDDFDRFVSAIAGAMESGTAVIEVMQLQADEIRRMRFAYVEKRIAKVPSKMIFPIVICIVPAMFIMVVVPLVMSFVNSGVMSGVLERFFK